MKINPTFASANKTLTTLGLPDDYFFLGLILCGILALFGSMKAVLYFAGAWWVVIGAITYSDVKVIKLFWKSFRRKARFCSWRVAKADRKRIQHG
jgi:type IV secretory pathway VirB3-like protein